ncbi:MAG: cysteine--tRNA ligase [Deltaproteobacteria bacterium]|nr:cysteine--tRNA ligase [Deltaproteobacteria bacterium]
MSEPTPFRLYSTSTRDVRPFEPVVPGHIGLYVCGMTVYDRCHVGHARAMVVFDTFVRWLRWKGWKVTFVRNFTDVDDKIIARANANGEDAAALAERYVQAFREDADGLGLIAPDHEPRVSTSIPEIVDLIRTLVDRGHAYSADGSVWFSVESFPEYGKLSGQKIDELRSADAETGKRHPADFALWKAAKPGEPSWESPWGPGRPGWHIECSAMSLSRLGKTLDIHGGGLDLVFPHHENEVAQSECAHGQTYARFWTHNGLLTMSSGQKMGKSLGNVINVQDALAAFPAQALRLYYLQSHYRSPLPWGEDALPDALAMLARLYEAREVAEGMQSEPGADADAVAKELGEDAVVVLALGRAFPAKFAAAMDEDFNTAKALGDLFELARAMNRFANHKKAKKRGGAVVRPALEAFATVAAATGLLAQPSSELLEEIKVKRLAALGQTRAEVDALIARRDELRKAKQFAEADALRGELEGRQIVVMDGPDGATWRVRLVSSQDA